MVVLTVCMHLAKTLLDTKKGHLLRLLLLLTTNRTISCTFFHENKQLRLSKNESQFKKN